MNPQKELLWSPWVNSRNLQHRIAGACAVAAGATLVSDGAPGPKH